MTKILRAMGYVWTPLAAFAWYLTFAICGFIFLVPVAKTMQVPFVGMTALQFFLDYAPIGFAVLFGLNALSGRWGPEHERRWDLWSTRIGFYGLVVIVFLLFAVIGINDMPRNAIIWLLVITAFGFYDLEVQQGEDWRSSTIQAGGSAATHTTTTSDAILEIAITSTSEQRIALRLFAEMKPMLESFLATKAS